MILSGRLRKDMNCIKTCMSRFKIKSDAFLENSEISLTNRKKMPFLRLRRLTGTSISI